MSIEFERPTDAESIPLNHQEIPSQILTAVRTEIN